MKKPCFKVLAYLVGAESKLFTEPPVAAELYNMGTGLLQRLSTDSSSCHSAYED